MTILVTGGAGYIGSHTCVELLNAGYNIIVVDNFSNSKPESLKRVSEITGRDFQTYELDILDKKGLNEVFSKHDIDAVIHFAGLKAVGESVSVPLTYYQNNVTATIILCEVMKQHGVKNFVFSSSAMIYGLTEEVPVSETALLRAMNPYSQTKLMIEEILRDLYHEDETWRIALLRYFNPIGAHQSGLIGEDSKSISNNSIPYISQAAIGKLPSLSIFGSDYPIKNGTEVRDYIHVVDLALGHLKALEKLQSKKGVHSYNIGTGNSYSVLEMVKTFEKASGLSASYSLMERCSGDMTVCFENRTKAKAELGWKAVRRIEETCEDTSSLLLSENPVA